MRLLLLLLAAIPFTALAQEPCATPTQWTPCDFAFELNASEAAKHPDAASKRGKLKSHEITPEQFVEALNSSETGTDSKA